MWNLFRGSNDFRNYILHFNCLLFFFLSLSLLYLPPFSLYPLFSFLPSTVPSSSVPQLSTSQQDSDVLLSWGGIPLVDRRGYLLGYNIYISNGSQLTLLGKCYNVKCLLCKQQSCYSRDTNHTVIHHSML